jgi:PHD/YefM family antitoxin component YafN of YafNO toxin-antitoxin module
MIYFIIVDYIYTTVYTMLYMFQLPKITTAKELQKNYRKIFDEVKESGEPMFVMRNSEIDVAIVDAKKLEEMQAILDVLQAREDVRAGKGKLLTSLKDLR